MNFVLVPGPWQGAWIWDAVARGLTELGHHAYPITLSGLADPDADVSLVDLEMHVNDVLRVIEENDLRKVVLVGHSSSGVICGVVADRAPDRVVRTVFVEAFLPHDQQSALDVFPEPLRREEERLIAENGGRWPVPDASVVADGQDISPEQARWLVEHSVGHPGRPLCEPVSLKRPLSELTATFVVCTRDHFDARLSAEVETLRSAPTWTFRSLDTGHWPMVSAPGELVALLDEAAADVR